MSKVLIGDVVIPENFEGYIIERTAALSRFGQAGIIATSPQFDRLAAGGGNTVNMPFWQDLTGDRQLLDQANPIVPGKIAAITDIARIQVDAQAFGADSLSGVIAGDDPLMAIASLFGAYWARTDQKILIASLKGVFGAATMAGNLHSIASESDANASAATRLNGASFVDALQKLGDCASNLTAVAMHSAVEAALKKLDLIDYIPDSEGKSQLSVFQGRRVVVDDGLLPRAGTVDGYVYRTYLFGPGAFAKGTAPYPTSPLWAGDGTEGVEHVRVGLSSESYLVNRRRYILHPRGVKFNSANCAGTSPTDVELALAANWTRVYEAKNVRMVAIDHNL